MWGWSRRTSPLPQVALPLPKPKEFDHGRDDYKVMISFAGESATSPALPRWLPAPSAAWRWRPAQEAAGLGGCRLWRRHAGVLACLMLAGPGMQLPRRRRASSDSPPPFPPPHVGAGDRFTTHWLTVISKQVEEKPIPYIDVLLTRSGEELVGVSAAVSRAPARS
jgi:hypothetical protein